MTMFIIQSALLLAIAYILGCILGCLLHRMFASDSSAVATGAAATAVAGSAATATAASAISKPEPVAMPKVAPEPIAEPAPKPASTPAPVAAVSSAEPAKAAPAKKAPAKKAPVKKAPVKKTTPAKAPVAAAATSKDDLKQIKGIGPQNEARLNGIGVTTFAQIAGWSVAEQAEIGERLAFPGRIEREDWVEQAKVLAKGGTTAFSKRVAKGEVASSKGKASAASLGKKPSTIAKPRAGGADNLTLIDGVGNALEKKLFDLGIYHFDQIAKWTAANQVWIGNELGFPGRPERENWVAESKVLAAGGTTEHAQRVERGEINTSRKSKPEEK